METFIGYFIAFGSGCILAMLVCLWHSQYRLRIEVERFVKRHHQRLKETDKAFRRMRRNRKQETPQ